VVISNAWPSLSTAASRLGLLAKDTAKPFAPSIIESEHVKPRDASSAAISPQRAAFPGVK